jgi:hypothetical protein
MRLVSLNEGLSSSQKENLLRALHKKMGSSSVFDIADTYYNKILNNALEAKPKGINTMTWLQWVISWKLDRISLYSGDDDTAWNTNVISYVTEKFLDYRKTPLWKDLTTLSDDQVWSKYFYNKIDLNREFKHPPWVPRLIGLYFHRAVWHNNLNEYKSFQYLAGAVHYYELIKNNQHEVKNKLKVVYQRGGIQVVEALTPETLQYQCRGAGWCVSNPEPIEEPDPATWAHDYLEAGPFYLVNINGKLWGSVHITASDKFNLVSAGESDLELRKKFNAFPSIMESYKLGKIFKQAGVILPPIYFNIKQYLRYREELETGEESQIELDRWAFDYKTHPFLAFAVGNGAIGADPVTRKLLRRFKSKLR